MTATITKITKRKSKHGGDYYLVEFLTVKKERYITYVYTTRRNYTRWKKVLKQGMRLSGLKPLKFKRNIIDADSRFRKER